jgi:hypothetical protein
MPDIFITMIKQNWNIGKEESLRILSLHESATKKLYLINEQEIGAKDNENVISNNNKDDKFTYFVFQPQNSGAVKQIDWTSFYVIIADDGENAYVTDIIEKNDKSYPIKFKVNFSRPLPRWDLNNIQNNEFKFSFTKTGSKSVKWNMNYDPKTANSLVYDDGNISYYAVIFGNRLMVAPVVKEGPFQGWNYDYEQEGVIDLKSVEENTENVFVPRYNVVTKGNICLGLVVSTTYGFYKVPKGQEPQTPEEKKITPTKTTPPPPSNLGDSFEDNISFPSANIVNNNGYKAIVDFIKGGGDMSKYVFRIQSSASKCKAGTVENQGKINWKDDNSNYPDVKVDSAADTKDIGNLNLTKARAQHLKDFLIQNLPELKNAKFEVVAQGSKGVCGTEEQNRPNRVVSLTVTKI